MPKFDGHDNREEFQLVDVQVLIGDDFGKLVMKELAEADGSTGAEAGVAGEKFRVGDSNVLRNDADSVEMLEEKRPPMNVGA